MIHVYGTSHVSQESIDLIEEKIEEHDPDTVALELDFMRLNALLNDQQRKGGPLFIRLIKKFQDMVGSKTGVMPGKEMQYAYEKAIEDGRDVALIDQEIQETVRKLGEVRAVEKVKAGIYLLIGFLWPGGFDASEIPEDEFIDQLLFEFRIKFPGLHKVLVEERNFHMIESLRQLQQENEDQDILAFVGAAHRKAIEKGLRKSEVETVSESSRSIESSGTDLDSF